MLGLNLKWLLPLVLVGDKYLKAGLWVGSIVQVVDIYLACSKS